MSGLADQAQYDQHFDISLPIPVIGKEVDLAIEKLEQLDVVERIFPFGHAPTVTLIYHWKKRILLKSLKLSMKSFTNLAKNKGSVSAEHGIGLDKKAYLNTSRSEEEINLMRVLKKALDPKGILNPGRIIDA